MSGNDLRRVLTLALNASRPDCSTASETESAFGFGERGRLGEVHLDSPRCRRGCR